MPFLLPVSRKGKLDIVKYILCSYDDDNNNNDDYYHQYVNSGNQK